MVNAAPSTPATTTWNRMLPAWGSTYMRVLRSQRKGYGGTVAVEEDRAAYLLHAWTTKHSPPKNPAPSALE
jgi:hypothetical protein